MARTVKQLGPGGQRRAERELGWNRVTIRKGTRELECGFAIVDAFALCGHKRSEERLPRMVSISNGARPVSGVPTVHVVYGRLTAASVAGSLGCVHFDTIRGSQAHRPLLLDRCVDALRTARLLSPRLRAWCVAPPPYPGRRCRGMRGSLR
jgi:hypothetical protein